MDGLIELVAASFARHGIECPAVVEKPASSSLQVQTHEGAVADPTTLPEHNYRKKDICP
jgi:hypothetical protein